MQERLLAALPVPAERGRRRPAVQARLPRAVDPGARLRRHRGPLRHPRAHRIPSGPAARRAPAGRRRRALALLRAARRHAAHRPADRARRQPGRDRRRLPYDEEADDDRPDDPLPGPRPALADRGLGVAPQRRARHRPARSRTPAPAPSCCRRCSRRRSSTRRSSSTGPWRPAPSTSPRRSTTSPRSPSFADAGDRYLDASRRIKAGVAVPVIASLNATTTGGWMRYARLHRGRRRRRPRAEPLPRRRRPRPHRAPTSRPPTSRSSPPSAAPSASRSR